MSKNKTIGIAVWGLGLILALVLMFCLERGQTATFWITLAFVCVAFVSSLAFKLIAWNKNDTTDDQFLKLPAITATFCYIIVQIPVCIIFAIGSGAVPPKVAALVTVVVLVIAWIIILSGLAGNDHIRKVTGRKRDHHKEL